jgi:hypothetical protein
MGSRGTHHGEAIDSGSGEAASPGLFGSLFNRQKNVEPAQNPLFTHLPMQDDEDLYYNLFAEGKDRIVLN